MRNFNRIISLCSNAKSCKRDARAGARDGRGGGREKRALVKGNPLNEPHLPGRPRITRRFYILLHFGGASLQRARAYNSTMPNNWGPQKSLFHGGTSSNRETSGRKMSFRKKFCSFNYKVLFEFQFFCVTLRKKRDAPTDIQSQNFVSFSLFTI